ncbi:hypothetical protein CTAM01_07925 [Colletotrichum tamarilloi]|uniref:Uncharacterized protein n=1 Tax=Colletotrichum tamarilloi TaxID=1209934 RepID=A0ABQ9R7K7_9PEZI|nr:uncharacterized protein CTAM01_07925 [Colletotrichum tamarilloi]KAK1497261.1 hypothetical protein CTAM01_07925 [Colletotrichum tamarilloi]
MPTGLYLANQVKSYPRKTSSHHSPSFINVIAVAAGFLVYIARVPRRCLSLSLGLVMSRTLSGVRIDPYFQANPMSLLGSHGPSFYNLASVKGGSESDIGAMYGNSVSDGFQFADDCVPPAVRDSSGKVRNQSVLSKNLKMLPMSTFATITTAAQPSQPPWYTLILQMSRGTPWASGGRGRRDSDLVRPPVQF